MLGKEKTTSLLTFTRKMYKHILKKKLVREHGECFEFYFSIDTFGGMSFIINFGNYKVPVSTDQRNEFLMTRIKERRIFDKFYKEFVNFILDKHVDFIHRETSNESDEMYDFWDFLVTFQEGHIYNF
jgi:hypothetical protein